LALRAIRRQRLQAAAERVGRIRSITVPSRPAGLLDRRHQGLRPVTTPPVDVTVPFRYFVALCIARSIPAPRVAGLIGLAKRIVDADMTPAPRHASATRGRHASQRRVDGARTDQARAIAEHALEMCEVVIEMKRA